MINIKVTEAELDLITLLLEQAGTMEDSTGQPAFELLHDLMEQAARPDAWSDPEDPDPLINHTFTVAEDDMIQRGIDAREKQKATSRAAKRRDERMMEGTASPVDWNPNDPANW